LYVEFSSNLPPLSFAAYVASQAAFHTLLLLPATTAQPNADKLILCEVEGHRIISKRPKRVVVRLTYVSLL